MKILLPLDGSDCSFETIHWVPTMLHPENTSFYLLQVVEPVLGTSVGDFETSKAEQNLGQARKELENFGYKVIQTDLIIGEVAHEICQQANKLKVDQVLIGSHGRTGVAKLLLGSVSSKVLEECEYPVFVYRNTQKKRFEMMSPSKML